MKVLNAIEQFLSKIPAFSKKYPVVQFVIFGMILSIIAFLPHWGLMPFGTMGTYSLIIIYTVVALGLNLLLGYSGLISLGTASFVGAGALGMGVFMGHGIPFEIAMVLTLVISGGLGALIGLFSLKVDGIYLAIATLFVGEILSQIYTQVDAIFGPGNSIFIGPIKLFGFWELSNTPQIERSTLFVIIVIAMTLMMIITHNIMKSRTGRALLAMSRSEHAAQAMGISLMKYRITAFVVATLFATFGGIMYALYNQSVPKEGWGLDLSLFIVAMVVVGGFKSIFGTFIGVFIIHGIPNLVLKDLFGNVSYIFSGILIILVILFYPNGFVYVWVDIKKQYYKLKTKLMKRQVKPDDKQ